MMRRAMTCALGFWLLASGAQAQTSADAFPQPINATDNIVRVGLTEFATLPDVDGMPARMMLMLDEPGTRRLFVNDMYGVLYSVSYDGKTVTKYLDLRDAKWGLSVQSMGPERGFQSFAFHPQFAQRGSAGFGKFYTYFDTANQMPTPDFTPAQANAPTTHDTVLLEWSVTNPAAATFDGGAPREVFRIRQPFQNHNAGHLTFNPLATPGSPDYGLLYVGVADGGSGGDPMRMAQNLGSIFGKVVRIDPLGRNSTNKKYGIPAANPFVADNDPNTLGEIYAYGVRNPQRFGWDRTNGNMYMAEIGQNLIEEVSQITRGGNLGWNDWEASYKFISRTELDLTKHRADPKVTFPIAEFDHKDALFPTGRVAATGLIVYRGTQIPQLSGLLIFGDNPSGEVFYVSADRLPAGGQDPIRRILFTQGAATKTFLQIIQEKNTAQKRMPVVRADMRFGTGPNNQVFLLNKADGVIRLVTR